MNEKATRSSNLKYGKDPASDIVSNALNDFQSIENRRIKLILRFIPLAILPLSIGALLEGDTMFFSGLWTAIISLIFFQILMKLIPYTLETIWDRKLIKAKADDIKDAKTIDSTTDSTPRRKATITLEKQYAKFIGNTQGFLNGKCQWAVALFFAILVFSWVPFKPYDLLTSGWNTTIGKVQVAEHLIAFMIGLMAWRMLAIGVQIWQLGKKFDLSPQLGHPDNCGGLEPLGNLCLWNALIASVPGIFLGSWIILGPTTEYGDYYTDLFYKLLLVPVSWAVVSFFFPLWSIHEILVAKRKVLRRQLNQLGQSINQTAHQMLEQAHELEPEQSDRLAKKLENMKRTYQQNKDYPVWPFNSGILKKLALSQSVQALSLTGLGKPIVDAIKIIADALNTISK